MELISKDDVIKALQKWNCRDSESLTINPYEVLRDIPTVEERREGRWVPVDSYSAFGGDEETWEAHGNPIAYHYCSECDEGAQINEFGDEILSKFCPNCGAKMKGE